MGNKPIKPTKPAKEELLLKIVPPVDRAYVRYLSRDLERIHGFTPKYPRVVKPPDHYIEYMQLHGWLDLDLDDPDLAHLFKHILRQLQSGWADGPAYVTLVFHSNWPKLCLQLPLLGREELCGGTLTSHVYGPITPQARCFL